MRKWFVLTAVVIGLLAFSAMVWFAGPLIAGFSIDHLGFRPAFALLALLPLASLAREQGVNVLVDLVPEQIPWVFSSIVVRRGDIAGRRDLLIRFLKGTIEGNYLALNDEKRAKEVLAKELKIADPKVLDITYNDFKAQSPANIEISQPGAENILAQFPGGSQRLEDYVDASLLAALKAEGYFTAMQQKYRR